MTGNELHAFCENWYRWCVTRGYFIAPGAKNIFARLQPSKVLQPPDAVMSANLSYFNMAVHALVDMKDHDAECFIQFYCFRAKNIKTIAARIGIHRDTFYERKQRFAKKAYALSLSLKNMHEESIATFDSATCID